MSLDIRRPDARRAVLDGLIDYAGLFPPAALDMPGAVAGYRAARGSAEAWILNRFVCPADRLMELAGVLAGTMTAAEEPWIVAATARPGEEEAVAAFTAEMAGGAEVAAVEVALPAGADVPGVVATLQAFDRVAFFEVAWGTGAESPFEVLAAAREASGRALGVKLRCGGPTAASFPSAEQLAGALVASARRGLPVKATAGLHHPIRHTDPATGLLHHGFLNVVVAAALAAGGAPEREAAVALDDDDAVAFRLDAAALTWGAARFPVADLEAMRRNLFVGFGSCSFDEPVADLMELGVLPVAS